MTNHVSCGTIFILHINKLVRGMRNPVHPSICQDGLDLTSTESSTVSKNVNLLYK